MFLVLEVLLQNSVLLLVQGRLFLQYLWFQFPVLECFLFLEKVLDIHFAGGLVLSVADELHIHPEPIEDVLEEIHL